MPATWLLVIVLALAALGYVMGRRRALASASGNSQALHSRPNYYGINVVLYAAIPALLTLVVWVIVQPLLVSSVVEANLPDDIVPQGSSMSLIMSDVQRVADGIDAAVARGSMDEEMASSLRTDFTNGRERLASVGVAIAANVRQPVLHAAQRYRALTYTGNILRTVAVLGLSIAGFLFAYLKTNQTFRARNSVEAAVKVLLMGAASIAVLTTVGIVFSLIFNTIEFFNIYPAQDFFLSLVWSPSFGGGSELGIAPLLWGTLYISFIALLVAVPIGLYAAIYLSEYASSSVRAVAKPLLEILAGIPTIVYGLFALLTVGPMLMAVFGDGGALGVTWMGGGTAVMTAGLVMGVMLIPFVSSLSDDIINAVPQSLRDGSLGLGATPSETIRMVVLPAALPGIVGAILLAASRAIGETMIVVLGAGAAARLDLNPFAAMTTVTAKIVSQLTGDADFASPEVLVAFSLGMSLFVITLGLNVLAITIVRKYREQYE